MTVLQTKWGSITLQADSGDGRKTRFRTRDGNEQWGDWEAMDSRGRGDWTDMSVMRVALEECAEAEGMTDADSAISEAIDDAEEVEV